VVVNVAAHIRGTRSAAERWGFAAFLLAGVGLALSIWFIVGSQTDTGDVRWWLVVVPLVVTATPVVVATHGVRLAAMIALGAWCVLAVFSIGMLQLQALLAAVVAVLREDR
jgi:hypothetical protein